MKGERVGRTSIHDATDPHPALRAGLSLAGRGVSLLLRWEQPAAFCPLTPPTRTLPAGNVGATRWVALSVRRTRGRHVGLSGTRVHHCCQGDAPRRPYRPPRLGRNKMLPRRRGATL